MSNRRRLGAACTISDAGTLVVEIVVAVAALVLLMTSAVQAVRALDRCRTRIEPAEERNTEHSEGEQNDENAVIERLFE
jgi:phage shock protein A